MKAKIFNKKNLKLFVPLALLCLIAMTVLAVCLTKKSQENCQLNVYDIKASYDETNHVLSCGERVKYINNSDNAFDKLYFHLYPNAFREGAKATIVSPFLVNEAYPNGKSYGNIEIESVKFESAPLQYTIGGEDENILEVVLPEKLYPDEEVEIDIKFSVKLPNINHRFGYGDNTINFGNFYPIACVYEDGKGFSKELYNSNGDPFYSDCANYNVEIEYPSSLELVASGQRISLKRGERITANYKANNVRDFCFVMSQKFECKSGKADGITINYYGYKGDENLNQCLKSSLDAILAFNDFFGDYPYKTLNVVKSNFLHGGMEYPGIVLISDKIDSQQDVDYCIVHEIAHQWWYGVVGDDEFNDAWFDEGLAEYSTVLFYEKNSSYGEKYKDMINNATTNYSSFEEVYIKVTGSVDGRMDRALNEFKTEPEYTQCVYTKGVLMHDSLRQLMGKNKYLKALKQIYVDYAFKNISRAEFTSVFIKFGGKGAEGVINSYLDGKVVIKRD